MGEIGRGNFGSVDKMLHIKTNTVMAVKVSTLFKDLLKNGSLFVFYTENPLNCGREGTEATADGP